MRRHRANLRFPFGHGIKGRSMRAPILAPTRFRLRPKVIVPILAAGPVVLLGCS
jgi:hypothetical protein